MRSATLRAVWSATQEFGLQNTQLCLGPVCACGVWRACALVVGAAEKPSLASALVCEKELVLWLHGEGSGPTGC